MSESGFPNIQLKGKGVMLPPGAKELSLARQPGEHVFWIAFGATRHGVLKRWIDGMAMVEVDGQEIPVPG